MKGHTAMLSLGRSQRRMLLDAERKRRKSGQWPAWEKIDLPAGIPGGGGWTRDIRSAMKNAVFSVLIRPVPGGVTHLAITSLSEERPTWWEAMRIKNEICGDGATAVEVYPAMSDVVDGANMYHLWVLPEPLPFGLNVPR